MECSFKINQPYVVSELIDGEGVIMNLKSGNYYSVRSTAVMLWTAYDADAAVIAQDVNEFIEKLCTEGLITRVSDGHPDVAPPAASGQTTKRSPYSKPHLEVFADMQDLLLLDPIHDITEAGWPVAKPSRPAN
jgi:hypothetical protein